MRENKSLVQLVENLQSNRSKHSEFDSYLDDESWGKINETVSSELTHLTTSQDFPKVKIRSLSLIAINPAEKDGKTLLESKIQLDST